MRPKSLVQAECCLPQDCHKVRASPRSFSLVALEYNVSLYVAALLFILIPAMSTQRLVSAAGG